MLIRESRMFLLPEFNPENGDHPMKILLVDDDPMFLEISQTYLEVFYDISSDVVESPLDALQKLENETYDVVVSDYEMPLMNGIAFLKALRDKKKNVPFILFTGRGQESIAFENQEKGVSYYLQKGGDPKSQYSKLSKHIQEISKKKSLNKLNTNTLCRPCPRFSPRNPIKSKG